VQLLKKQQKRWSSCDCLLQRTGWCVTRTDRWIIWCARAEADGFRNYLKAEYTISSEEMLIDKAQLMTLTVPQMTVLLGGMRVLNTNFDHSNNGVFTQRPEVLTNDFFLNLLDMTTTWKSVSESDTILKVIIVLPESWHWYSRRFDIRLEFRAPCYCRSVWMCWFIRKVCKRFC
jgi:catalase (peroxidase I)